MIQQAQQTVPSALRGQHVRSVLEEMKYRTIEYHHFWRSIEQTAIRLRQRQLANHIRKRMMPTAKTKEQLIRHSS